jgi:hypothetical protein
MSDLITFSLSQLAPVLALFPAPGGGMGSASSRPVCTTSSFTNNGEVVFLAVGMALKGCLGELFGYELFWDETALSDLILFKVCCPFR